MKLKTGIIATLIIVAGSFACHAQTKCYTLRECMDYAIANSAAIQIQEANMDDNRIARRDAILAAFTPAVDASGSVASNFGRSIDPGTNTYVSTTSFNNGFSVSAGITLFNGFEAINNLKITRTANLMGVSRLQQEEDRICLATIEAYYNVAYYTHLEEILEEQVKTSEQSLLLARRMEELGQKSLSDVIQLEADLADRRYEYLTASNNLKNAYITLQDVMFWPMDEELVIDVAFADEGHAGYVDDGNFSLEEVTENALNTNPAVIIAEGNMKKAEYSLKTARWQLAPRVSLYAGWSTSYYSYVDMPGYAPVPYWQQFRNNGGEYVQLSVSIPIYGRLSRYSNISRRKNEYKRMSADYDKTRREVASEVKRAVQDEEGASLEYLQAEKRSAVQKVAYELNRKKFEQGLISPIEFRTASENYLKAKAERLNALLRYNLKKKVVAYYSGIPYLEQEK